MRSAVPAVVGNLDRWERRYTEWTANRKGFIGWFGFVWAPLRLSSIVFVAGLFIVAGSAAVTVGVSEIGDAPPSWTGWLLTAAFAAESGGFWVKERAESLLTVAIRQLAYRRYRRIADRTGADVSEQILTNPPQISQIAYTVDFMVSALQTVVVLATAIVLYGPYAVIAAALIAGLAAASVRLIGRIGALWSAYNAIEGRRRSLLGRIVAALPRAAFGPSWQAALTRLKEMREEEVVLLIRRVRLQMVNGFLNRGALTAVLAVAVAGVDLLMPRHAAVNVGLIVAAQYLYGAVQNNLVNYRVVRLAVPMLRQLDDLDQGPPSIPEPSLPPNARAVAAPVEAIDNPRQAFGPVGVAFVARDPEFSSAVLQRWASCAPAAERDRFEEAATRFGLGADVVRRAFADAGTLSNGERHRLALALALAGRPELMVVDDAFASMDLATRESVAAVLLSMHEGRTVLLYRSPAYVPAAFQVATPTPTGWTLAAASVPPASDPQDAADTAAASESGPPRDRSADAEEAFGSGMDRRGRLRRTIRLLFGWPAFAALVVSAFLLAGAQVVFAVATGEGGTGTGIRVETAAACGAAAVAGAVLFFGVQFHTPIARLTALHHRLVSGLGKFRPWAAGSVVGRLGQDLSDLQMDVPGAVGTVLIVVAQTGLMVLTTAIGAPVLLVAAAVAAPLALVALRVGGARLMAASANGAARRNDYLAVVRLTDSPLDRLSPTMRASSAAAYAFAEDAYVAASVRSANAIAFRSALVQGLVFGVSAAAVWVAVTSSLVTEAVAPSVLVYFSAAMASGLQSTIESLHRVGVVGLTTERILGLETWNPPSEPLDGAVAAAADDIARVAGEPGATLIAVVGRSGAGKSRALDALAQMRPQRVLIAGAIDVLADVHGPESHKDDQTALIERMLRQEADVFVFDETLNRFSPADELRTIRRLREELAAKGATGIVVLHSEHSLQAVDRIVALETQDG